MDKPSSSLDEQIRKAMEEGYFDNLPGKGKPLGLQSNPHEHPEWGMAYHVLRTSGFTLPWIETRRVIEQEFEETRSSLERSWHWRCNQAESIDSENVASEWRRALEKFEEKVKDLNKRIFNYNLEIPSIQFRRLKIDLEQEISKITKQSD